MPCVGVTEKPKLCKTPGCVGLVGSKGTQVLHEKMHLMTIVVPTGVLCVC